MDIFLAPCGAYCGLCDYHVGRKTPQCPGCGEHEGHPFHGPCRTYACAKEHAVEHCGLCGEFPCDAFVNYYDPRDGQKSAFERAGLLAYRRRAGTERYVEMMRKLSSQR